MAKSKKISQDPLYQGVLSKHSEVFTFMENVHWLGFDLALRNNAIVRYEEGQHYVVFSSSAGPGQKDLSQSLLFFQRTVVPVIAQYPNSVIALDWSRTEGFMRTNKMTTTYKTFIAGYLYRSILEAGSYPIYVSPAAVRRQLGLKSSARKEEVWSKFHQVWTGDVSTLNEHELDALILAWSLKKSFPLNWKNFLPSKVEQPFLSNVQLQGFM